jgi:hypothetical protein
MADLVHRHRMIATENALRGGKEGSYMSEEVW